MSKLCLSILSAVLAFAAVIAAAKAQLPPAQESVGLPPDPKPIGLPPTPQWIAQPTASKASTPKPTVQSPTPAPIQRPQTKVARVAPVTRSGLAIGLADFARMPASGNAPLLTRINFLFHAADGSHRLFVNDMRGRIYVIRNGAMLPAPFLDVAAARGLSVPSGDPSNSEFGILTFAFHPDFNHRGTPGYGKFYTLQAELPDRANDGQTPVFRGPKDPPHHNNVLVEWSVDPNNPDRIYPRSSREILRLAAHSDDHAGGQLGFNPNAVSGDPDYGQLYISVGDGGNTTWDHGKVEEYHLAQNMMSAFGKILRINPLRAGARSYSVPSSNPFLGRKDVLPEIWASGLRNPQRFSWDRGGAKKMLIADIGQATVEEINLGKAGANYGWGLYEGEFLVDHQNQNNLLPLPDAKPPDGFTFPVAVYGHADGSAVTGGFVYRGKQIPELVGKYIFGDLVSGVLFAADAQSLEAGTKTVISRLRIFYRGAEAENVAEAVLKSARADLRLGMDEDGEIYVLTKPDGGIRKIVRYPR